MKDADSKTLKTFVSEIHAMKLHRSRTAGAALKKPLLLLLVISRVQKRPPPENIFRFSDIRSDLDALIRNFGGRPTDSGARPEQPFYHMGTSPFWTVHTTRTYTVRETATITDLMDQRSYARLAPPVFRLLSTNAAARAHAADAILQEWWPPTLHGDLIDELGLSPSATSGCRHRNPEFVARVLENFAYSCAFCGFHSVLNRHPTGIDAAHIHWHSQDGPDVVQNGIALCKLHHWAFDKGVLGLDHKQRVCVADALIVQAHGGLPIQALDGRRLAVKPSRAKLGDAFLTWHRKNVYLGVTR